VASFCAEEEFYLLTLPYIFWNVDWLYAHHLLFVINVGLYVGNLMKDVFCLPRPNNVWRPSLVEAGDSTGLLDYGFPSTHTMNGISNSLFTLLYFHTTGYRSETTEMPLWACLVVTVWWICSISFSRLYMGVHSPTDLRGGAVVGICTAVGWYLFGAKSDMLCRAPGPLLLLGQLWLMVFCFLLCCPQPRPPTPTFLQNAVNMGLIAGNLMGANLHAAIEANASVMNAAWMDLSGTTTGVSMVRYLLGLACVLTARVLSKSLSGLFMQACGLKIKAKKGESQLSLTGLDLAGLASQKFIVYFTLSTGVTAGGPALFHLLGLYSQGAP